MPPAPTRSPPARCTRRCAGAPTRWRSSKRESHQRIAWCTALADIALAPEAWPGLAPEPHLHRGDAAMREHGLASRGFGDDGLLETMRAREERRDAARIVGFLVAGEQERGVAALASAAAISAAAAPLMSQAPRPMARSSSMRSASGSRSSAGESGTVSRCTLNSRFGLPRTANSDTAPAPWSITLDVEARQLRADVPEHAAGADGARRIAGVERHQRLEMREDGSSMRRLSCCLRHLRAQRGPLILDDRKSDFSLRSE